MGTKRHICQSTLVDTCEQAILSLPRVVFSFLGMSLELKTYSVRVQKLPHFVRTLKSDCYSYRRKQITKR